MLTSQWYRSDLGVYMDPLSKEALELDNRRQLIADIVRGVVGIPRGDPSTWSAGDKALLAIGAIPIARPFVAVSRVARAGMPAAQRLAVQGGALASKPKLDKIREALESHGVEFSDAGDKIVAKTATVDTLTGKRGYEVKTFDDSTSLQTLRDWLGY